VLLADPSVNSKSSTTAHYGQQASDVYGELSPLHQKNESIVIRNQTILGWSFVYIHYSHGTPFDSPNRSEPCCS
jgi:hypothetical protein